MAGAATAIPSDAISSEEGDLVRAELERLCNDPLFRDTTRMKRFLRYVTEETLAGRGGRLKGYVIGVEVFDRPDDFDPQADTIVRVQAGQLRRRLDLYYAERGQDAEVRILVPKGRYAPTFEIRQSPDIETEADPEGFYRPTNAETSDPRPCIAVMTLDDLSPKPKNGEPRFADGVSAEIVNALVQFRSMRIITLGPTVTAISSGRSVREVGAEYGADFILSGSVRRDGQVFRVTVSLIRCLTGEHLFSRVYDREFQPGGLFNLQEEIASYTAAAVAAPYGAVNRYNRLSSDGRQDSMAAYNCVLRYYDIKLSPTRNQAEALMHDVTRVTESQPDFSTGWAIRSLMNVFMATQCLPPENIEVRLNEAKRTARRALSVDGQNAMGYYALFQAYFHQGRFDDADRMIRRALSLNPNDYSKLAYYAICLALRGEMERASIMQSAALRLIGRAPTWYHLPQMIVDFSEKRYDSVAGLVEKGLADTPAIFYLFGLSAKAYLGEVEETRAIIDAVLAANPNYQAEASISIELWHLEPKLARQVYDGLALAGLDITSLKSSI
ncbi:membrane protein [Litorimonas cladophorae]|uniref:Membrane protein n=1 Tax=Litorimonas cladophorae TaxID=1220491 RepID=A0A918KAX5_9PROT|nr:tetratricopeptide repeat protein [Litorimonas cladophorae]GGX57316.1 membrane protein [Litorimonas cladophorae]